MFYDFNQKVGLVCGASQGIGLALVKSLLAIYNPKRLYATVRDLENPEINLLKESYPDKLFVLQLDASEEFHYKNLELETKSHPIDFIINSIGILKFSDSTPERRVDDINTGDLMKSFEVNTLPTLLLAKYFKSQLRQSDFPFLCTISAKVGSIDDNQSGGWYGYRMSKAALNMAIKNLSIELKRINTKIIVSAVHPGTTETNLSAPFIEAAKKRYTVHSSDQTAKNILNAMTVVQNGQFISWDKSEIKW